MVRTRPAALIALSVALPVAAVLGVQLGRSAISEINPIHFRDQPGPRAVEPGPAPAADPYAQAYDWDQGYAARAADCGGDCSAREPLAAGSLAFAGPLPTRGVPAPYWRDVTPTTELRPWAPGEVPNGGLGVERYMHYPIQAEAAGAPPEAADAKAPPADDGPADAGE